MELNITSLSDLSSTAASLLDFAGNNRLFLFYGEMGAGKTTLIKSLCAALGVKDEVTSPTFSIVNQYEGKAGMLYHFDFYRIKDQNEALDMGYEEYFFSGDYCFIEWPEKISGLIPDQYTGIRIVITDTNTRHISVENI